MQQGTFRGAYPALITPMDKNGDVNYDAIQKIIEFNPKNQLNLYVY